MKKYLSSLPKASILCLGLPVVVVMHLTETGGHWGLFLGCCITILGTVTLIGKSTEEYAIYAGPVWGGLMNATFGNVTELIIAFFALKAGLHEIVRSSITGSILGNLLLVLGASMFYGGLKHSTQKFSQTGASVNIGMLMLTLITLVVPSFIPFATGIDKELTPEAAVSLTEHASLAAAITLLFIYFLSLLFSLRTHRFLLMPDDDHHEKAEWSKAQAIATLLVATVGVAYLSDVFVEAIEALLAHVHISKLFVGVVVVAVVGNAAEGSVAIWVARENKMDLSFQIAMGSCLQVALMVAPVLVIASFLMGNPMTLTFNVFELLFLGAGVAIAGFALIDGESNWLEGAMFLAVYCFFAMVFFFHP
ncbi:MAG: calcium/proton exchanger [Candidatus Eremiobacteraeota bacterium]|nr:calcium/proton exchanger [Candidatus Eremiobacteraeota bacterium]